MLSVSKYSFISLYLYVSVSICKYVCMYLSINLPTIYYFLFLSNGIIWNILYHIKIKLCCSCNNKNELYVTMPYCLFLSTVDDQIAWKITMLENLLCTYVFFLCCCCLFVVCFWDGVLLWLPRLECNGVISAHHKLYLRVQVILLPQPPE